MSVSNCTQTAQTAKIKFKLTNAYDVHSADALSGLHYDGIITDSEMIQDECCILTVTLFDPVISVLEHYGMSYDFINPHLTKENRIK